MPHDAPYDAVLLVSFGGPEGPDDVVPFLENVTRGRGIPRERLESVGEHYFARGGVSPINAQNRLLLDAIQADFAEHGIDLPVYWGNRNWAPYLADAVGQMADDGRERALAFVTSAYSSYSGCRQYREDLAAARATVGLDRAPQIDKVRQYADDPGFVGSFVDGTVDALGRLDPSLRAGARLVFTTHSLPESQAQTSGPSGDAYVTQHLAAADAVAQAVAQRTGLTLDWDLAYQSRSGPPTQPWLEPDVCDHLRDLHDKQVPAVVLVPIGFVSDHLEVVHDLDTEAAAVAAELGLPMERAATPGVHPRFVAMVRELVVERLEGRTDVKTCCPVDCCPNPRAQVPSVAQCS